MADGASAAELAVAVLHRWEMRDEVTRFLCVPCCVLTPSHLSLVLSLTGSCSHTPQVIAVDAAERAARDELVAAVESRRRNS